MKIRLINYTHKPAMAIAMSARTCYAANEPIELTKDKLSPFIHNLQVHRHWTPFRFASFTFQVYGVSRICTHQLVRHGVGFGYCQQSQRFVKALKPKHVVIPPKLEDALNHKPLDEAWLDMWSAIERFDQMAAAMGVPQEDRRYAWLAGSKTNIRIVATAEALLRLFGQRCDDHAQWEIRELAEEMRRLVDLACPEVDWWKTKS